MRAAGYSRISEDVTEEGKGIERQRQDILALIERKGWTLVTKEDAPGEIYEDNDIGASTRSTKPRPDFDSMIARAKAGEIDVIVAYSNSRLSRRPAEWIDLINLANAGQVQIVTVASGQYDLSTADGRAVAMTIAIWDAAEVERLAERVARQKKQRAEEGKPQGGRYRTYGFERDWTLIPNELKAVAEMFERRAKGESMTAIGKDLTEKGILTSTGKPWRAGVISTTLANPLYAGLRKYNGEIIGKISQESIPHVEGVYPAVSEEVFNSVQDKLADDSKGTGARSHLGSGFLICKNCLTQMKGNAYTGNYRCSTNYGGCGKISVRIDQADLHLKAAVMQKHLQTLSRIKEAPKVVRDFAAEELAIQAEIKKLQDGYNAEIYTLREVQPLIKEQREKLKALEKEATQATSKRGMQKEVKAYFDFVKMNLSQRRAFISGYIENVVVLPRGQKGNHVFQSKRLEFHFTDGEIWNGEDLLDLEDAYGPVDEFDEELGWEPDPEKRAAKP
jgi:DNA invertase Pin-like site-specific DNA recombinase